MITGSCLCGTVAFEISAPFESAGWCHCTRCQGRTGSGSSAQARIDGNTLYGVYRRIMLPMGAPALLSVGILNALFCWNDVLISLITMQSAENRTLMVGVTALRGQYSDNIPLFASGVVMAALPVLIVYLFFQKQITDGVTAGSTKG